MTRSIRMAKGALEAQVPILRSSAILRPEYFGGILINHFLPPEMMLDRIRFRIASMCNGAYTLQEIKRHLREETDHSSQYVDFLVDNTLRQFEAHLLLYWREKKLDKICNLTHFKIPFSEGRRLLSAPIGVIWELTRACNLKCKHCFSDSGRQMANELSTEEIKNVIDLLADKKVLYINFTGGEPLLRSDIFDILNYASSKKIAIDISSNGFLITRETVEFLKKTNVFQLQLSLDDIGESHDQFRGIKGSFDRILNAIKLLQDANFGIVISTTINKTNVSKVSALIDFAVDVGVSVFKTTLFIPTGRGMSNREELALDSNDVRQLALTIMLKEKEVRGKLIIEKEGFYPWLLDKNDSLDPAWIRTRNVGCAAGTSSLFITADGNAVPCPFLRNYVIGNLCHDNFTDIWYSDKLDIFRTIKLGDLKGKCKNCEYLGSQCFGGCRAAALASSGDLYAEDPLCWNVS